MSINKKHLSKLLVGAPYNATCLLDHQEKETCHNLRKVCKTLWNHEEWVKLREEISKQRINDMRP